MDGFDHGDDHSNKGYSYFVCSYSSNYSRFGSGRGIQLGSSINNRITKDIGQNLSTIYLGIAFLKAGTGTPIYNSVYPTIVFHDESFVSQVKIYMNPSYGFSVYNGNQTLLGSTNNNIIIDNKWYFLEIKVTVSDTVGEVTFRLNESQVLNLTSKDTKIGTDYIRYVSFCPFYLNGNIWHDDFYIDSSQFHGDCEVKTFYPDADGNSSDFTRSTGANDYECVDEVISNGDTDYIYSDTLNHKSLFGITTGVLGTVKGIQVNNNVRIDQAGTRKITPLIRSNSTNYSGTETDNISANYIFYTEVWETDPDDSNAWTQTKLEAAEFGLEITT
jgi:hypothetical protein